MALYLLDYVTCIFAALLNGSRRTSVSQLYVALAYLIGGLCHTCKHSYASRIVGLLNVLQELRLTPEPQKDGNLGRWR